jgi:hypothetical protein
MSSPRTKSEVCLLQQSDGGAVLGLMALSLSTTKIMDRWLVVHGIVLCLKRCWNPLITVNRGMLTNGVVLHHDNAWPHMAAGPLKRLKKIGASPPPSIQSRFHPIWLPYFWLLKDALCRHQFENDKEVRDMVHTQLHVQPETFFTEGIRKFMDQSNKCVEKMGLCQKMTVYLSLCTLYRIKKIINWPYFLLNSPHNIYKTVTKNVKLKCFKIYKTILLNYFEPNKVLQLLSKYGMNTLFQNI